MIETLSNVPAEDLGFLRTLLQELTHEIAAPLTPLFGHLDLLELKTEDKLTPMQMRCMRAMRRSLRRLSAIIDRMLELARIERGHIPCELIPQTPAEALDEVVRRHANSADSLGVTLMQRPGEAATGRINADWNLLVIGLGHLVENAIRYAPKGSQVVLDVVDEGGACALRLIDHGTAVPESELSRISRPFYRVIDQDGYTETAGLGLTIVELIARRHAGHLGLAFTDLSGGETPGLTARLVLPWID